MLKDLDILIAKAVLNLKVDNSLANQQVYINLVQARGWAELNLSKSGVSTQSTPKTDTTRYDTVFKRSRKYPPERPIASIIEEDPTYVDWAIKAGYIVISPDLMERLRIKLDSARSTAQPKSEIWTAPSENRGGDNASDHVYDAKVVDEGADDLPF